MQICLNGSPVSITMRTPGADLDLAVGFLFTERIINDVSQILSMRTAPAESDNSGERVTIWLQPEVTVDPARVRRNFYTSSSCGVAASSRSAPSKFARQFPCGSLARNSAQI